MVFANASAQPLLASLELLSHVDHGYLCDKISASIPLGNRNNRAGKSVASISVGLLACMHGCRFEGYDLHELVVLDQHTVGIIVSVTANSCKILTNKVRRAG
jgi:hypothetical protein